jgi:hypothetical protein
MMEQLEVPGAATVPNVLAGRPLSDEVRASLEAVRLAQVAARARARRQTVRARIWLAAAMGAAGLAALAFGPRIAGRRHARPQAATPAAPAPTSPERTAPAIEPPATAPVVAPAMMVAPATVVAPVAQAKAADVVGPVEGCDTQLLRRAPWRLSAQACARAFAADPTNAVLALAIAHAEHAHGSVAEAAQWANRALALDAKTAEAYLLIARADVADGRPDDARTAYRRYLELAPRGWHKAEARAAVHAAGATAPAPPAGKR